MLTGCGEGPQRLADGAAPRRSADLDAANGKYARKCGHRLNLVPGDRVQQPAREVRIEPAELHSILVRGGLVGLILAPPHYGVLSRVIWTLAESMERARVRRAYGRAIPVLPCDSRCY
jgi:hypothetical protein